MGWRRRKAFICLGLVWGSLAEAKEVKIEWMPISGSIRYNLQIQNNDDGKLINAQILDEPKWKGDLNPGTYAYQIRGVDRAKRPGKWSSWKVLAVLPPAPEKVSPKNGSKITHYRSKIPTHLSWDPVPGINKYSVTIQINGQPFTKVLVEGTHLELKALTPGEYQWSVNSVLTPGGRSPASAQGKTWETHTGQVHDFDLEVKKLEPPKLVAPLGQQVPPDNGKLKLKWSEVEGAELYEVQIFKLKRDGPIRIPTAELSKVPFLVSSDTSLEVPVQGEGAYIWGVRALANLDEKKTPGAIGAESLGRFTLDRNSVFKGDKGYVALSAMLAPYTYKVVTPIFSSSGANSMAEVVRVSGEYWLKPQWSIAAGFDYAFFQLTSVNASSQPTFGRMSSELLAKYRFQFSQSRFGWGLSPKLGLEFRQYDAVTPDKAQNINNSTLVDNKIFTLGASIGFDLRKQFSEKFSIGLKVGYFFPISVLSGVSGGANLGGGSYRNWNVGLQGIYWIDSRWGAGLGGFYDMRSIDVTGSVSGRQQVYMDAAYFFGSIIFKLSK